VAIECVDGGTLEDVLIDSVTATNTGNALFIRLGERSKKDQMGQLRNVTLKNIKVEVAFERPDYGLRDKRVPPYRFFTIPSLRPLQAFQGIR
jgi:hypothetical protein